MRLTLLQAKEALAHTAPADRLEYRINRAEERFLLNGKYSGSIQRLVLVAPWGQVALPRGFRTIEGVKVDGYVYDLTNNWYEFLPGKSDFMGFSLRNVRDLGDGWATMYTYTPPLAAPPPDPTLTVQDFPLGGTITVDYTGAETLIITISGRDANGLVIPDLVFTGKGTHACPFARISRIHKEVTDVGVQVTFTSGDTPPILVPLAMMEPTEEDTFYRRYMIDTFAQTQQNAVQALCKRRHLEFTSDKDVLAITNLGALELGMRALQFESENDKSTATQYWDDGIDVLNKELEDSHSVDEIPALRFHYVGGAPKLISHM